MSVKLQWNLDGRDWPNREASQFVKAAGMTWHVQVMGSGPVLLLLHGTGSSTHSWRDVMPLLAKRHTVVAPDLPGHAFTSEPPPHGHSLPGMAEVVSLLLEHLALKPSRCAGHSAGAAILVRMCIEKFIAPEAVISFNGAFFPVSGVAGPFFKPMAKMMASSAMMPKLFAAMADRRAVERLLRDTGSKIDARGLDLYQRLFSNETHVAGTLAMMAAWDLHWVDFDLRRLNQKLVLVKALGDRTVPPSSADRAARLARHPLVIPIDQLGHLAHEEAPDKASAIIKDPDVFALATEEMRE